MAGPCESNCTLEIETHTQNEIYSKAHDAKAQVETVAVDFAFWNGHHSSYGTYQLLFLSLYLAVDLRSDSELKPKKERRGKKETGERKKNRKQTKRVQRDKKERDVRATVISS